MEILANSRESRDHRFLYQERNRTGVIFTNHMPSEEILSWHLNQLLHPTLPHYHSFEVISKQLRVCRKVKPEVSEYKSRQEQTV